MLQNEIKLSDNRLKLVKSGLPLDQVAKKKSVDYYTPDLDAYFNGAERAFRKAKHMNPGKPDDERQVKFFITEAETRRPATIIDQES